LKTPATYVVFDILERDKISLLDLPLVERKKILKEIVKEGKHVVINTSINEQGVNYYQAVLQKGLEGVIAKRKQSSYQPGSRSKDWLKIKKVRTLDAVVFGYTLGKGYRAKSFGSLILGLYDEKKPVYVGRVGSGFSDNELLKIIKELDAIKTEKQWFTQPDTPTGSVWVEPHLVVIVGFRQLTEDNRLRDSRFLGFRDDKPPELCTITQLSSQFLEDYYDKRDFTITSEPVGGFSSKMENSYVIQKHQARSLHWDFRLERDGVLISWAIPKGLPEERGVRRLAIKVEDHPLEYGNFEGTIPKGQYGAGTVEILDKGFYIPIKWMNNKIEVVLAGKRLQGRYELIKFGESKENNWLIFRKDS
jgi:DNA ligase D-like protein (predicted 3'-phosphoesterase)